MMEQGLFYDENMDYEVTDDQVNAWTTVGAVRNMRNYHHRPQPMGVMIVDPQSGLPIVVPLSQPPPFCGDDDEPQRMAPVATCSRCMGTTHTADVCYSKLCTNDDCPRPVGHTAETCFKCERCNKRGHVVKTCRVPVCSNPECGRVGHTIDNCYKLNPPQRCANCDQFGHAFEACTTPDHLLFCIYCRLRGHVKSTCRRLEAKVRESTPPCSECNDTDHGRANCPYIRQRPRDFPRKQRKPRPAKAATPTAA